MSQGKNIVVMKFGGTSVGSAARMEEVLAIALSSRQKAKQPLIVLSAMSGVTNLLIEGAQAALARDLNKAKSVLEAIGSKHYEAIETLFGGTSCADLLRSAVAEKLEELLVLYKGVSYLGELSKRSLDAISGFGELLSSKILAKLAQERGHKASWLDAREILITDDNFGKARPVWDKIETLSKEKILPCLENGDLVFTQGFIGRTAGGVSTTLGRGGSDYSASIFGVALDVSEIQIWTDVNGMMSADPRVVGSARVLPEVSFQEAAELAYFGAKVLHPLTIYPAVEKNIPVRILNTMNPEFPGTSIKAQVSDETALIRAVAAKKNITAIYLSSPTMLMSHGYLAKVFEIFDRHKIAVDLISTSEVSIALTIDSVSDLSLLEKDLSAYADVQISKDVSIVSVVGRQFREQTGIAGRVFKALAKIPILMISGGASDINLSFVVPGAQSDQAVRSLHDEFFPAA